MTNLKTEVLSSRYLIQSLLISSPDRYLKLPLLHENMEVIFANAGSNIELNKHLPECAPL